MNPLDSMSVEEELREYRKALAEAFDLLSHARPEFIDTGLRRAWGRRRRKLLDQLIDWCLPK